MSAYRDLYVAELDYLHSLAEEVGREHERIAPMLGRGADPGVTRLVQSVAFLAARLRQRLDDDLPEVVHPIVEAIAPWLLAPIPGATIVELLPEASLKEPAVVGAGSPFASRPIDGAPCVFRSAEDVVVRPWTLESVDVAGERTELRLSLRPADDAALGSLTGPLRIFLASPLPEALDLRGRLVHDAERVVARIGEREWALAGVQPVPPAPLGAADPRDGRFALRAYFAWPEQFAFVDIGPLDPIGEVPPGTKSIDLVVRMRRPLPRAMRLDTDRVRLHAVVATNVSRPQTVSVPYTPRRTHVGLPRGGAQVAAISRVTLVRDGLSTLRAEPFARFFPPPIDDAGRAPLLYRVERSFSPNGGDVDVALSFGGEASLEGVTTVEVEVSLTDGERATSVGIGEVCVAIPGSSAIVAFRNITAVTRPAPPPIESGRLWEWLHLFKASLPQLLERPSLGRALAIANVGAALRWPGAKPSADDFEPLLAVRWKRATRAAHGEVLTGAEIEVDLDTTRFAGAGDVDLFAERLAALFASTLRDHEWLRLTARDREGAAQRVIGPLSGTRDGL